MQSHLDRALEQWSALLPHLARLAPTMERLGQAMLDCWRQRGKILFAGNGGSAADANHFAEELVVRFEKTRRALAAISLCDGAVVTCAANDFGYETVFSRQVEALGNPGDLFVGITTSGNSANVLRAFEAAKSRGLTTVAFLGKDGGKAKGLCEIELLIPSPNTARVQEAHKLLYHCLCQWIDAHVTP